MIEKIFSKIFFGVSQIPQQQPPPLPPPGGGAPSPAGAAGTPDILEVSERLLRIRVYSILVMVVNGLVNRAQPQGVQGQ